MAPASPHWPARIAADAQRVAIGGIAQFADITGPVVRHQAAQGFRRQRWWRAVVALGGLEQEFVVERRDVLSPFAQGRQLNKGTTLSR